ncbi:eukaryotic translation elongation factor 1 delta a (guanine nucleotide exchange protein) isoform X2 [Pseudochaenichthys georgianus]|uniref:eukaryotic translation elongation factor 1 delta a (guanine nucleotide exchange protein) isoform X2 n=1 Tax=Pseudochaenichthys georgianus TaxID=52239 RepID=UPI00146D1A1D|nr:eukaryotic translation elongation factor 1 delta a (guanine nucleotide exchange protein) isoform X2 [Pseudochaenichthys georgianus]
MDQSRPSRQPGGVPQNAVPVMNSRQGNNPTERSVISGDKDQSGRLRRRTRPSEAHRSWAEDEGLSSSMEGCGPYGQSPLLQDMQADGMMYNHGAYEQAEGNYQRRLASNGNGPLSSSPRSPKTRGFTTFQARRGRGPQQDQGPPVATVKVSGTPSRQYSRGRNRTSSETEQGGKGSRGPTQRKRVFSETESRPRWDNTNMSGLQCLASENIWFDKPLYDEAEKCFYEGANGPPSQSSSHAGGDQELVTRMKSMELENHTLHKVVAEMRAALQTLENRVATLEKSPAGVPSAKAAPVHAAPVKQVQNGDDEDEDDDMDLFGSDDEDDEEAERLKQERLDAYAAKKSKKPALIAKSSLLLDVKPWDDETDMAKLEECVRSVQMEGLLWGASKLVPVGYGIKKLQITCVIEDDKVGTDMLEEEITKFEDFIQSIDVAAFNKI